MSSRRDGDDDSGAPSNGRRVRQLEEELRLERARLAFALRVAGIVAWEWEPVTDAVTQSVDAAPMLGLPPGQAPRTREEFFSYVHPDDRDRLGAVVARALRGEGDYNEEFRLVRADGRLRWCADKAMWIEDETGSWKLTGILVDITERKEQEEQVRALNAELAQRAEELQTLLDVLPVGVFIADNPDGVVTRANPTGAAMLGLTPGEGDSVGGAEDAPPYRLTRGGVEVPASESPLSRAARAGRPVRGEEAEIARADGTTISVAGDATPLFDEEGRARGAVGACMDVTERSRAEAARAEEARRKDEFLATLAHELRNPLAPIRMALEVLHRGGPGAPEQEPALGVIDRQLHQLDRLVADLLDVSRITRGKVELREEPIAIASIIERAIEANRPALDASGHKPRVKLPAQGSPVLGDPARLAQALGNLVHNAAKHTSPGGEIRISAHCRGDEVRLTVSDDGVGIAPDALPRIFDIFAQGDTSLERSHGGLGIGLTIAKQLVEMHGGRLVAASEGEGRGSEFTIRIPREAAPEEAGERARPARARAVSAERRVLVVDDNPDAADTLSMVVELDGNEVTTAYGARQALEMSRSFRPEIVFLDIGMPEMNGFDVARRLRQQDETRRAVIVAVTGWGQEAYRERAREAGFDHHMVKPVSAEAVAEVIGRSARE